MEIEYQKVAPEQFEEAVKLFDDYFLTDESTMSIASNHQASDVERVNDIVRDHLKENLSWCAVEAGTGKMVGLGVTISLTIADAQDSPTTSDEYVESGWSKHYAVVLALLDIMLDAKKIMVTHNECKMMEVFAICVHRDYRNKGIASEMVRKVLDHAKTLGFTLSAVNCSNIYALKLFEKLGFEKIREESYESYVDAATGVKIFKDIDKTHPSTISYVKRL